jgi:dTDP-4-amino-4,6-dideoxy-D-glucose ammonia-lyase
LKGGNKRFKDILNSLPKTSAISISGGLEPLTNPQLDNIISHAKSLNIRVPLITNGYSLTPNYLKKHPGLWDLDSLRISLYGIDEESYDFITRKPNSYNLVKSNTINFLKQRNEINPNLKFGFNYIIIPETMNHMLPLVDLIEDINSQVDNGPGIDFLTLREDFGSVTEGSVADDENRIYRLENFISNEDRKVLVDTFKTFKEEQGKRCPELHVDYGYALVSIADGIVGKSLMKVDGTEMRKSGFPQLSVAVDLNGDIFLYREAGFLDRPGNDKFIIGRISKEESFETIVKEFIKNSKKVNLHKSDSRFMDAFDHVVTILLNQAESDNEIGIPFDLGPVLSRSNIKDDIDANSKKKGLFGTFHQ